MIRNESHRKVIIGEAETVILTGMVMMVAYIVAMTVLLVVIGEIRRMAIDRCSMEHET